MKKIFTILGVLAVTTAAFSQELLLNPGFENGLAPWTAGPTSGYTAPVISSTAPHSGANYAEYINPTKTTGFFQNVPVVAGKTYVISFWYKSAGDDSDTRLWSIYKTADGAPVYTTPDAKTDEFRTNEQYLANAASWTKYTAKMVAGPAVTNLDVGVRVYGGATVAQFDDFSLMDNANLAVTDVTSFDKQIKMNTIVGNALTVILPEKSTVNIYSVEGKLMSSNRVSSGESINTSSLTKGMYIVTIDNGSVKVSRKVMKN